MPTFRRGNDGSFLKAANSILAQSLRDIELIVVDDGSRDGTARQIEDLMTADGRVSCLRHPENIGLPAISEYEAFVRARGEYIAFGFDDFVFGPSALSDLWHFPRGRRGRSFTATSAGSTARATSTSTGRKKPRTRI